LAYFLKTLNNPYCDQRGGFLDRKCDSSFTLKGALVDKLKGNQSISMGLVNLSAIGNGANLY